MSRILRCVGPGTVTRSWLSCLVVGWALDIDGGRKIEQVWRAMVTFTGMEWTYLGGMTVQGGQQVYSAAEL